ncbi:MAG: PQQ-binding-like beta-propeller repeat protein [Pseudohongiellaceae bacterium]
MHSLRHIALIGTVFAFFSGGCTQILRETSVLTDWPVWRGDPGGSGFSPLSQISSANVSQLAPVWNYSLYGEAANARNPNSQATPVVVNGLMYLPASDRVVALNPVTGEEVWRHVVVEGAPSRRGVAYWDGDGDNPPRIVFTAGRHLVALDAITGSPVQDFGDGGTTDMVIPYNSVPLIYDHIVIAGANTPPGTSGGIGNVRAFDVRTGDRIWEFSSVSQPGDIGHDTWVGESWEGRLGVNAWPFYFTTDVARELLFVPLAAPLPYAYGGDRPGANLFANSLVALDIRSGAYVWHFQTIHHDLWDHDPPAPPVLFDIPQDNGILPALAVSTKSGYIYILHRETGESVFGVEERPVPQSEVPGEQTWPTQPIPVKPPAVARVSYDPADLVTAADTSAEHAAACEQLLAQTGTIVNEGPFTPWVYRAEGVPPRTTLLFPGLVGGPNWGGIAYDPGSRYLFAFAQDVGSFGWMEAAGQGSDLPFQRAAPRPSNFDVQIGDSRLPCQQPPWGRLTAVDSLTGDIVWQQALGITEGLPAGRENTGRPGRAGAIVTASGLLFIAATDDSRFRALEAATGRQLWESRLEQQGNANPMTYLGADGRQYIVIAATDSIVAYALP